MAQPVTSVVHRVILSEPHISAATKTTTCIILTIKKVITYTKGEKNTEEITYLFWLWKHCLFQIMISLDQENVFSFAEFCIKSQTYIYVRGGGRGGGYLFFLSLINTGMPCPVYCFIVKIQIFFLNWCLG